MCQCDCIKVTCSQLHGSLVPKTLLLQNSFEFPRQDFQSSYSFGKIQNVGKTELSGGKEFSVSLEKDFIFRFHIHLTIPEF